MDFDELLQRFEEDGYDVEKVTDECAVVYNNGEDRSYSMFDNYIATVTMEQGFGFAMQADAEHMYDKTVRDGEPAENYEIYMGVYKGEDQYVLEQSSKPFRL